MTTARKAQRLPAWVATFARFVVVLLMTLSFVETSSFGCGTACDSELTEAAAAHDEHADHAEACPGECGEAHEGDCPCPCQCPGGCSSSCRVLAALPVISRLPSPPVSESGYSRQGARRPQEAEPVGILHVPRVVA